MRELATQATNDAIGAFGYLTGLGGGRLDEADSILLTHEVTRDAIVWRGGISQDATGRLSLVEAVVIYQLSEAESARVAQLLAFAYRGFYAAAADGIAVTDTRQVTEWYGGSVTANYPEAGPAFLRFATTYWTMKVLGRRLQLEAPNPMVAALLDRIDALLGPLFFPHDGLVKIDANQREADQRRFLKAFGPTVDVDDFLRHNPILIRDRDSAGRRWWRR